VSINVGRAPATVVRRKHMPPTSESQAPAEEPVVEETLVEEVSIDGMCGVY
jgi:mycofactocin precursor